MQRIKRLLSSLGLPRLLGCAVLAVQAHDAEDALPLYANA